MLYNYSEEEINIKIENLENGSVIKNYKELCKILEIKNCGGNSKKAQLEKLGRNCDFEKKGRAFIINEVYDTPTPKCGYENFIPTKDKWDKIGIYAWILDDSIYIGQTGNGFRKRYLQHIGSTNKIKTAKSLIDKGAVFDIIFESDLDDKTYLRDVENYYMSQYKELGYNVVNQRMGLRGDNVKKYMKIKVSELDYEDAVSILNNHGVKVY